MNALELPQGTIRYRDIGNGPPLVFVHGFLVNGQLWRKVVEPLSATHRCIVPDLPLGSHELPMNPDADLSPAGVARIIADLLAALELNNVTLVGNDSGGGISQIVAAHHPERIGRLVLTNCDALEIFPPPEFGYLKTTAKIPGLIWLIERALFHFRPLRSLPIAYGAVSKKGLPDDLVRSWLAPGMRSRAIRRDTKKFVRALSPRYTLEAAEILARRDLPVLLLWGTECRFFRLELAERLQRKLRNARLERIEGSWAFVPEDQPDRVAKGIARFVSDRASKASINAA